jgi:DNA-binding Lrp family transcriptional regulator
LGPGRWPLGPTSSRPQNTCSQGSTTGATVRGVLTAFVLIDAEPARVAELAEEVASVEGVAESYSVAGHADVVAVVRVRQIEDLAQVVTRRLHALPGVTDTRTLVAFQSYSRRDLDAMWELGAD